MGVKGLKTYLLNKKRINNPEVIPNGSKLLVDALGFAFQGIIYNIAIIITIIINHSIWLLNKNWIGPFPPTVKFKKASD